jgi:NADH:ubiquinone oxidoreductase subunit 5 (subunit L)/multisubunit Na+/H+ antiporter MnhA subunit
MIAPLVVLAILATIGGLVGVGPAFKFLTGSEHPGGKLNIVNWLNPIIWNPETGQFNSATHGAETAHASAPEGSPAEAPANTEVTVSLEHAGAETAHVSQFNLAHAAENLLGSHLAAEWLFIIISLIIAALGIGLGYLFYIKNPLLPDLWANRLRPLYQASYNKYWVDEFYGWAVTRRVMDAARAVYAFDSKVVDGVVNGLAWLTRLLSRITGETDKYLVDGVVNTIAAFVVRLMSPLFRAAQTGLTQNYALVMVLGLVVAVALFFGADLLQAVKSVFAVSF